MTVMTARFMKSDKFAKIESIKELREYGLPVPETVFIFNFAKQEKEIDKFLRGKKFVSVRSDKAGSTDYCPHMLRCPHSKAKGFIKTVIEGGCAAVLQKYTPLKKGEIVSGNILALENRILVELMDVGPLVWLTRKGEVAEQVIFDKKSLKETGHFGKRLISSSKLAKIARYALPLAPYRVLEFTLRTDGLCFWQIKDDPTAKRLDNGSKSI